MTKDGVIVRLMDSIFESAEIFFCEQYLWPQILKCT